MCFTELIALGYRLEHYFCERHSHWSLTITESMVSVHCTTLLGHVSMIMMSCFNTDFASQMKLAKHPLIHCIRHSNEREFGNSLGQDVKLYVLEDTSEI